MRWCSAYLRIDLKSDDEHNDLLAMMLEGADVSRLEDLTPEVASSLRDQVITIFLAGYETVANAMTWTWYLLSQNPEAEARMHAEVDAVLGGREATVEDVPQLKYTEMVMAESLRLAIRRRGRWAGRRSTISN